MADPDRIHPDAGADSQPSPEAAVWNGPGLKMPEQLGRYRIKKRLGGGGMGSVFLVENTKLGRDEALKVPNFDSAGDAAVRERFLREAGPCGSQPRPSQPVPDLRCRCR
jgi:serine/threonine-protein kinase